LDFSAGQYAILIGIGDIVESSERYDWAAIGLADLGPVVVLFVCAQQAFGIEGVGELFDGRSGFLDTLEAFPLPRAVASSDQLLRKRSLVASWRKRVYGRVVG